MSTPKDALQLRPAGTRVMLPTGVIVDSYDTRGNKEVVVQDQFTPSLDIPAVQARGAATVTSSPVAVDDLTVTLDAIAGGSVVGDVVVMTYPAAGKFYIGEILAIATNTLTLDSPFDFAFPAGTQAIIATRKMDVNGSITSQAFDMRGLNFPLVIPVSFDITRIMIQMTTATAISFGAFGDIAGGLANGIVLRNRKASGDIRNIWNVKTNADFALLAYDYTTYSALTPPTIDGLAVRYTFAGQEKHGVTVRLDPGDSLQLLVQDDLSSLVSFRMLAQGHVVE